MLLVILAVALAAVLAVALWHPSSRQASFYKPADEERTVWQVGNKLVERWYNPNDGDTIFLVDGKIAQKWSNQAPDEEELKDVLSGFGVQVDLPWILQDTQELDLNRVVMNAVIATMEQEDLEKLLAKKLMDPADG